MQPNSTHYSTTRFEFNYGHAVRIVDDPHNRMQWVFGNSPELIEVVNGQRRIVYNEHGAIIKSNGDAIDVQNDMLKHKGWMGIWSEGTHFTIDTNGVVQE